MHESEFSKATVNFREYCVGCKTPSGHLLPGRWTTTRKPDCAIPALSRPSRCIAEGKGGVVCPFCVLQDEEVQAYLEYPYFSYYIARSVHAALCNDLYQE
eukprot:jgi/Mesvir1/18721/Mv01235-RA.1